MLRTSSQTETIAATDYRTIAMRYSTSVSGIRVTTKTRSAITVISSLVLQTSGKVAHGEGASPPRKATEQSHAITVAS